MHALAEAYGARPSSLIELQTEWAAWQFDEACLVAGRAAEKDAVENSGQFSVNSDQFGGRKPQKFSSLRGKARKKVDVKDGVF